MEKRERESPIIGSTSTQPSPTSPLEWPSESLWTPPLRNPTPEMAIRLYKSPRDRSSPRSNPTASPLAIHCLTESCSMVFQTAETLQWGADLIHQYVKMHLSAVFHLLWCNHRTMPPQLEPPRPAPLAQNPSNSEITQVSPRHWS